MIRLINSLGATRDLPISVAWRDVPLAWNMPAERLAGHGSVLAGDRTIEPRSFELRGSIYFYDKAQIRTYHDDLLAFLQHTPLQAFQHHEDTRYLLAYPVGNPQQWIDARQELQMQVQMTALDPLWYGVLVELSMAVTNGQAWTLTVDGTAPTHPTVRFSLAASGTEIRLMNNTTGQTLALYGGFIAGDVIEVDCERYTVAVGGQAAMDVAGDEWLAGGFGLLPGTNELSLVGPSLTITHSWRSRWL